MARWNDVETAAPEFAESVAERLGRRRHKTLSTLRRDGSPRVSGIETMLIDGDIYIGSMAGARKSVDLRRDPRFALHCIATDPPEDDPSAWDGDVSLSGNAVEVRGDNEIRRLMAAAGHAIDDAHIVESHLFRLDIDEVVSVRVHASLEYLEIEAWHADGGFRRVERR